MNVYITNLYYLHYLLHTISSWIYIQIYNTRTNFLETNFGLASGHTLRIVDKPLHTFIMCDTGWPIWSYSTRSGTSSHMHVHIITQNFSKSTTYKDKKLDHYTRKYMHHIHAVSHITILHKIVEPINTTRRINSTIHMNVIQFSQIMQLVTPW